MSTLFVMRHGQASFGQDSYDKLSPTGYRQGRIVAEHLHRLEIRFDAVFTGSLIRHQQTFEAMSDVYTANGAPLPKPTITADLNEYDATGIWKTFYPLLEGNPSDIFRGDPPRISDPKQFQMFFARLVRMWIKDSQADTRLESWAAFRTRVRKGLRKIMQEAGSGQNVMVLSSAGPIAVGIQLATDIPDSRCIGLSWQMRNASITRFRFSGERMTLMGFNDIAALEVMKDQTLLTYR